jgi:hypothetical protein
MPWLRQLITALAIAPVCVYALADGTEPKTSAFRLPVIKQIVIQTQGSANQKSDDEPKGCAHFRLTKNEVLQYLRAARAIDHNDFLHTIDWSPCAVSGTVALADGRTGEWSIHKLRGGSLKLSDGTEFFLYCAKCNGKKFAR